MNPALRAAFRIIILYRPTDSAAADVVLQDDLPGVIVGRLSKSEGDVMKSIFWIMCLLTLVTTVDRAQCPVNPYKEGTPGSPVSI